MANWYLDAAVGSSGNGQAWATAWKASSNVVWGASGVKAGDTLYVATGTYSALTVGADGTSGSRITLRASQDTHTGTATFDGGGSGPALTMTNRGYITVNGQYGSSRNLTFQNGRRTGASDPVIEAGDYPVDPKWLYCNIQNGREGINAHNIGANPSEVGYCYFYDLNGEAGYDISASGSPTSYGIHKFHHNEVYFPLFTTGGLVAGIDIVQCLGNVDYYDNVIHGYYNAAYNGVGAQHPDPIQAQAGYLRLYNNTYYNWGDSCIDICLIAWWGITAWANVQIYNNVMFGGSYVIASPWKTRMYCDGLNCNSVTNFLYCNNTIVDSYPIPALMFYGQNGGTWNPTLTNCLIQNNLIYNSGAKTNSGGYYGAIQEAAAAGNHTQGQWACDYNLLYAGASGSNIIQLNNSSYTQAHPRTAQPSFVNHVAFSDTQDFHLASGDTAAKGQGVDLSAYFTTDKDGTLRTAPWSIGAYQGAGTSPPAGLITLSVR
jgi:hypothetical protein